MADVDVDRPIVPEEATPARRPSRWAQGLACLAMLLLLGFIGLTGRELLGEWSALREDRSIERAGNVVGYVNITPKLCYASRPADWVHDEGESTLMWSGWVDGKNRWFRVGRGEINRALISFPMGKDALQAIDHPLYEKVGEAHWDRIPDEAIVACFLDDGRPLAFPIRLLDKVEVVNEKFGGRPVLIAMTPRVDGVSIYEAAVEGRRVVMGHSGYFFDNLPILYDRETESLWSERDGSMVAVAGRRKGAALRRVASLPTIPWGDWKSKYPESLALIGADRSRGFPVD